MGAGMCGRSTGAVARRLLLLTVILHGFCALDVLAVTRPGDVTALNALATAWSATARLNWYGDPCDDHWSGISCDNSTGTSTVVNITVQSLDLVGTLPSAIGDLINLQVLETSRNARLTGPLPKELGNLSQLHYLSLQWCGFSGRIPAELGNLVNATFLGLNGNRLEGSIPPSLGNLHKLDWLDISNNTLTGTLPVSTSVGSNGVGLDNLTDARHFHLNDNRFYGSIPPEIFSLPRLWHLILDHNNFSSTIPPEIANMQTLTIVRFDNNHFTGDIPPDVGSASRTTLQNLNLQNNNFTGTLPDLSNFTNLQLLDVSNNQFSEQEFPSWLSSMSTVLTVNLGQSNLVGRIPTEVFALPQLQVLNVSHNKINGTLEFVRDTPPSLQHVDASNNSIVGFAGDPGSGGAEKNLTISLKGNPVCDNPFLGFQLDMTCSSNMVYSYWYPDVNQSCSGSNCQTNSRLLNTKTCQCARPLELTLILTAMTFSNLTNDIAANIEETIANSSASRIGVPLGFQQIVIASGILRDDTRYQLDLHFFPAPGGTLSSEDKSKITDALNQRRIPLMEGPYQVPSTNDEFQESGSSNKLSGGAIAGIVIGICALVLLAAEYAIAMKRRADKAKHSHPFASWGGGDGEYGEAPMPKGARWISLAELKSATDNWSVQKEIGEGKYGRVYKGVLTSGTTVAVKRARQESLRSANVFKVEIEKMSRAHHNNLVGLVGFYFESHEQNLIFQYLGNGTLRDYLLGGGYTPLTWQQRLNIALGSARGLAYLHDNANPPMIHGNVKSGNILLNERLSPKVSDFAMFRLVADDRKMEHSGYLDPQCQSADEFTYKSDVYSFGVVMFELLSAKAPVTSDNSIVDEFESTLARDDWKELRSLLDPAISDVEDKELDMFLRVALGCVAKSDADRPGMSSVVKELERMGAQSQSISAASRHDQDQDADAGTMSGRRSVSSGRRSVSRTAGIPGLPSGLADPFDSENFQYSGGGMGVSNSVLSK